MASDPGSARMQQAVAVAANFNSLRGLILLPMGGALIVAGTLNLAGFSLVTLPFLALALVAQVPITRYYQRNFGRVRSDDMAAKTLAVIAALAVFTAVGIALKYTQALDGQNAVWLTGLQAAATMSVMSWIPSAVRGRWRDLRLIRHWCAICAVLAACALVPVGLWTGGDHPLNRSDLATASLSWVFGAAFLVGGVLDHRSLARTMRGVREARR
ncbi:MULTISPECIES: hypothetical protein [Nocardiopsidaceae]|uniref:Uncharacterized protein n=1 Tax=Streptomonospora salina TaxID=104205 RepID=A0A841EE41_9ACTN|nr:MULTISPECIES: hypothetical protein [Nocardiopsaceae]MBB5999188.1 hypothetical protein [Streptomonospora salina]